jgi:hypothetical protein
LVTWHQISGLISTTRSRSPGLELDGLHYPEHDSGDYNVTEIADLFGVSRPTVYRSLERTASLLPDTRPALANPPDGTR